MNSKSKTMLLLAILMIARLAFSQELIIPTPEINENTKKSFFLLLDDIPSELLKNYGINNKTEIKESSIGNPIAVFTFESDSLKFTNTWRIPLIIDNEFRALFTLYKNSDNEYKVVDFGAASLAKEFFNFGKESDFSAIIRVYQLRKDFFMFTDKRGEWKFRPIPAKEKREYRLHELIELIK